LTTCAPLLLVLALVHTLPWLTFEVVDILRKQLSSSCEITVPASAARIV